MSESGKPHLRWILIFDLHDQGPSRRILNMNLDICLGSYGEPSSEFAPDTRASRQGTAPRIYNHKRQQDCVVGKRDPAPARMTPRKQKRKYTERKKEVGESGED